MTDRTDALRATSADLIADAAELEALERRKAALDPDDPRLDELAARAEELVRDMVPKATVQREIVSGPDDWEGADAADRTSDQRAEDLDPA